VLNILAVSLEKGGTFVFSIASLYTRGSVFLYHFLFVSFEAVQFIRSPFASPFDPTYYCVCVGYIGHHGLVAAKHIKYLCNSLSAQGEKNGLDPPQQVSLHYLESVYAFNTFHVHEMTVRIFDSLFTMGLNPSYTICPLQSLSNGYVASSYEVRVYKPGLIHNQPPQNPFSIFAVPAIDLTQDSRQDSRVELPKLLHHSIL